MNTRTRIQDIANRATRLADGSNPVLFIAAQRIIAALPEPLDNPPTHAWIDVLDAKLMKLERKAAPDRRRV